MKLSGRRMSPQTFGRSTTPGSRRSRAGSARSAAPRPIATTSCKRSSWSCAGDSTPSTARTPPVGFTGSPAARCATFAAAAGSSTSSDALQSSAGGPAAALERREDQRILLAILGKIREERRTTFVLFEIEGLSGEEIARIQSVPLNTVWTRLYHARRDFAALAARFREAQRRLRGDA